MTQQYFRTRLTDLLGIKHPILLGGMMYLGDASIVGAIVNAGAMGFITARSFRHADDFRDELVKCWRITDGKPFGVNVSISARLGFHGQVSTLVDVALEQGVRVFETAGVRPDDVLGPVHNAGGILIHKCPRIRHALSAQRIGVDAIILVGMDEGGHPGLNELSSMVQAAHARDRIHLPLMVGGGIGHGRQIAAALAMGMDGVVMGSRFLAANEINAHEEYKKRMVEVDEDCSTTALTSLGDTWRVLDNDHVREVQRIEAAGAKRHEDFGELIRGYIAKEHAYDKGDWQKGMISCSSAAGFVDAIEPAATIVERLMKDAAAAMDKGSANRSKALMVGVDDPVRADASTIAAR
ncbi:NAD(P)H-dependent flavin oxidoreductase [Ferrovibrio sp.]|uniref:NAD(P)H-dependent flavin oxidoreductase n=1 Tax=Ferrovibrio sp. TaxID=1917215 RepID=UPI003D0B9299